MTKKKSKFLGLSSLVLILTLTSGGILPFSSSLLAEAAPPPPYAELEFPPLPEVNIPEYERYELDNGMVVYLMEDHELPLVSGNAIIRTGSRFEPGEETGLAGITGTVMRSGGTEQHPADELNQLLEQRAASVETSIDTTSGGASFSSLTEDVDTVFNLFAEVLTQPAFPEDKIALAKRQLEGAIARRNDDPGNIASREFQKLVYGETSPYARTVEYETLDQITREDIVNFYKKYYHPENIILGIYGDFDAEAMKARLEEAFGDWQPDLQAITPPVPNATQAKTGGIFLVDQPHLTQSNVLLGHLGGRRDNPDYPALTVLNEILNGFGGRLFNEVRSRQGLAYSVYGYWSPRYDYDGMFIAGGQTRSEATVPFIKAILAEVEEMRNNPVTEKELANAKDSILNSFVFQFQDPSQTMSRLMSYEYYGYPEDFLFQYKEAVEATTVEDILRVAQAYLQPDQIVTLVVGNSTDIQPDLSSLGVDVETVDISPPTPPRS
jgi:zinc protease